MNKIIKAHYKNIIILLLITILICMFINNKIVEKSFSQIKSEDNNKVEVELNQGTLEQNIICNANNIYAFDVEFNVISFQKDDKIQLIIDKGDNLIQKWDLNVSDLKNNSIKKFKLSKNKVFLKNQIYKVTIDATSISKNSMISVIGLNTDNTSSQDNTMLNGAEFNNTKIVNTYYYMPDKTFILIVCLFTLVGMYLTLYVYKRSNKESHVMLGFLLTIGIAYFVLIPTFAVPDEYGHFYRSMEIAQGDFLSSHAENGAGISYLPQNSIPWAYYFENPTKSYENELGYLYQDMDTNSYQECSNPNQALYSPFSYVAQALGVFIARLLTNNVFFVFFAGRLFNFISSIIMLYFAIKWIPIGKRMILIIVAMPMFLQEMISYSSDSVINSVSIFVIALIMAMQYNEKFLQKRYLIILWLSLFIIALCKIVYLPFILLVLLVNKKENNYLKYKIGVLVSCVLGNLIWLGISFQYIVEINPGVNTVEQIKFVLTNIGRFIQIVANTIFLHGFDWILMLVGKKLSWGTLEINGIIILPFIIFIIMEIIFKIESNTEKVISKKLKINIAIIVLVICALIFSSLYAQWTPLKHRTIEGIQGRYFIPLLLCLGIIVKKVKIDLEEKKLVSIYIYTIWILNMLSLCEIYQYFA